MPIVRLFFYKLSREVEDPYTPGKVKGIGQQIASEISSAVSTADEAKRKSTEELIGAVRVLTMAGNQVVELLERERTARKREFQQTRAWLVAIGCYVVVAPWISAIIDAFPRLKSTVASIGENLAANLLAALLVSIWPIGLWLQRAVRRDDGQQRHL